MALFKKLLKKKEDAPMWHLTLQLNARLMPTDRGAIIEDTIDRVLKERGIGAVDGGGTLMSVTGEIKHSDVEIYLNERSDKNYDEVYEIIMRLGAPKGSILISEDGEKEIGDLEGLALYLSRADLDANPKSCEINRLWSDLMDEIKGEHKYGSYWEGKEETALYFYGRSFDRMNELTARFIKRYPLRNRIVQVA
jgi:hypothetical protein